MIDAAVVARARMERIVISVRIRVAFHTEMVCAAYEVTECVTGFSFE